MPSAYGIVNFFEGADDKQVTEISRALEGAANTAMDYGLFVEWLMGFVAAWEATKDALVAAESGLVEWDL